MFDSPGLTQSPPGPHLAELARRWSRKIYVTSPGFEYGDGAVFYTSFHNRAQVSEQERILLQLLVLKQISTSSSTTVAQASQSLGISLTALKRRAGG